jgi:hypothetical protein
MPFYKSVTFLFCKNPFSKAEKSRRLSEPAAFEIVEGDYKKLDLKS